MSGPIHQEIIFKASAKKIYEALTISSQFSEFTNAPADITVEPGGKFSCFGGMITGQTIEAISNRRLVQAWRVSNWEPGIYSIVKFELEKIDELQTRLHFDHTGFPEEHREHLFQGWNERYWEPLRKYLSA